MKVLISGIGWVTAAGCGQGRQATSQPLIKGDLTIPERKEIFSQADRRFGRLDNFSRIGLGAATFCLRDAALEDWSQKRDIAVIVASRYGCLQTDLEFNQPLCSEQSNLVSPNLFAYTLPNSFLGDVALRFGLASNCMILNSDDAERLKVLKFAVEELIWSDHAGVLAGVVDLAPPPELARADDLPGGLFLLLEKGQLSGQESYGSLALQQDKLYFESVAVENLSQLITLCLGQPPGQLMVSPT